MSRAALPTRFGTYEPLLQLASGGMASVHIARQLGPGDIERLVALKRVHPHLLEEVEFRDLFRDEARISANVRHPNVAPLIEVYEQDDELLLVFEYVEGTAMSSLLGSCAERGEHMPASIASRIVCDALAGLSAAHEARDVRGDELGLIHRDVSPQNVLVGIDGASRLIDFGIAKIQARISNTTAVGIVRGKLAYMAPEQIKKQWLDQRADIFSAGVVLYEALTGTKPFSGETEGDILLSVLLGEVAPPSSLVPGLSPTVDAVVSRALERDREGRFATAAEFQEALEHALPPASQREVAQLVQRLRGEQLAERRAALRALLHHPSLVPTPPVGVDAVRPEEHAPTGTTLVMAPRASVPPRQKRSAFAVGLVIGLVALAVTTWRISRPDAPEDLSLVAATTAQLAATDVLADAAAPLPIAKADEPATEGEDAGIVAASPAPPAQPVVRARNRPAPPVVARPATDLHRNPYAR